MLLLSSGIHNVNKAHVILSYYFYLNAASGVMISLAVAKVKSRCTNFIMSIDKFTDFTISRLIYFKTDIT